MELLIYAIAVFATIAVLLLISRALGERHTGRVTAEPFESGMIPLGDARGRLPVKFYRVALLFVIFDMEAAFLFAWAVAAREAGWTGFLCATVFILVLLAALFYLVRMGALEWGGSGRSAD